jgi:DamX protein
MVDNKDLNQQIQLIDYSLITPERTAKLELLIHLINNSTRAIVLCGAKGVGKTTLLSLFQQQADESLPCCLVQGRADLTLEQIVARLLEKRTKNQTLMEFLEQLTELQQKIVLIIDDAGALAPSLINTLLDYIVQHPSLKLVFVLTHDELSIKIYSDNALEDCHIIELPPLSEQQCGDFLRHLAIKSTLGISLQGITDSMITNVYQKTHGIPAQILAQLPILSRLQKNTNTTGWLLLLLAIIAGLVWINHAVLSSLLKSLIDRLPFTQ